jgi:hypothetical protein
LLPFIYSKCYCFFINANDIKLSFEIYHVNKNESIESKVTAGRLYVGDSYCKIILLVNEQMTF